jgi:hypothetical protein
VTALKIAQGGFNRVTRRDDPKSMTSLPFHVTRRATAYWEPHSGYYRAIHSRPLFRADARPLFRAENDSRPLFGARIEQ